MLFEKAGINGAGNISSLGAGEFNSVYSVDAGGRAYVIKIAPPENAKILTYEKQMMEQELFYYNLMNRRANISVPHIYYSDFSRRDIPTDYFIMDRLPGEQFDRVNLTENQKAEANESLVAMVAGMHSVSGENFGYRQNGFHDNWYLALSSMVENLINDCRGFGRRTRRGAKLARYVTRHREILEKVECSLINFDIWPPNIFCDYKEGELKLSWIDPERCLCGDRIADFVCLDFMNMSLDEKGVALEVYNRKSANPIIIGDSERVRFALMLGYLGLIMEVEKYARYTIFNFGFWRNLVVTRMIFRKAFSQLGALTTRQP